MVFVVESIWTKHLPYINWFTIFEIANIIEFIYVLYSDWIEFIFYLEIFIDSQSQYV